MKLSKSWLLVWLGAAVGLSAAMYRVWSQPLGARAAVVLEWRDSADSAWFERMAKSAFEGGEWSAAAVELGLYRREGLRPVEITHRVRQDVSWTVTPKGATIRFSHANGDSARQAVERFASPFLEKMRIAGQGSQPVREISWPFILSAVGVGAGLGGGFSVRHYWRKFMGF